MLTEVSDEMQLTFKYQGCADAGLCYVPETKQVTFKRGFDGNFAQVGEFEKGSMRKAKAATETVEEAVDETVEETLEELLEEIVGETHTPPVIGGGGLTNLIVFGNTPPDIPSHLQPPTQSSERDIIHG